MFSRRQMLFASALVPFAATRVPAIAQDSDSPLNEALESLPPLDVLPGDPPNQIFGWTNIADLTAYAGLDGWPADPGSASDLIAASQKIVLDSALYLNAALDLDSLFGFTLANVDQGLFAFEPPRVVRHWTGSFDPERISAILVKSDYVESRFGSDLILVSPFGDGFDFTSPISQIALAELNYLIVSESRIITTATREMFELLLGQPNDSDSLRTSFGDSPLPEMLAGSTSSLVFPGTVLSGIATSTASGSQPAVPAAKWFAADVLLDSPDSTARYLIEFEPGDAESAAETIADRIEAGVSVVSARPYAEILGEIEISVLPNSSIVQIAGTSEDFTRNWSRMIFARDLMFLSTE